MFNLIPTRLHGMLDYLVGLALIAAPWVLGFDDDRNAMLVPVVVGISVIIYSLLTDYELGIAHLIPMPVHLLFDLLGGLLLVASPWLFGFSDDIWWPHVAVGLLEIVVVLLSQRHPLERTGTVPRSMQSPNRNPVK